MKSDQINIGKLLETCPESQQTRTASAWRAVAAGQYEDAAFYLRNAAREFGPGTIWGAQALAAAEWAEAMHRQTGGCN